MSKKVSVYSHCICVSCGIFIDDRIIATVGKHIIAENALAGGGKGVSIDKSTNLRIVITRL